MPRVAKWNPDKPHRCPNCNTVFESDKRMRRLAIYVCCQCGTEFAQNPLLVTVLSRLCPLLVLQKTCSCR